LTAVPPVGGAAVAGCDATLSMVERSPYDG
jgi:hypothetical protein